MRFQPKLAVLLALALIPVGCATKEKAQAPMPFVPERKPTVIGQISLVNKKVGFVLIDSRARLTRGTTLLALDANDQSTATLVITPVQQPPFLIADVVEGSALPGQRVIVKDLPKATPQNLPPASPAPMIGSPTTVPTAAPVRAPEPLPVVPQDLTPEVEPPAIPEGDSLPLP